MYSRTTKAAGDEQNGTRKYLASTKLLTDNLLPGKLYMRFLAVGKLYAYSTYILFFVTVDREFFAGKHFTI